jgi:hypothetical protein
MFFAGTVKIVLSETTWNLDTVNVEMQVCIQMNLLTILYGTSGDTLRRCNCLFLSGLSASVDEKSVTVRGIKRLHHCVLKYVSCRECTL